MRVGETVSVGGYVFSMDDVREVKGANYVAAQGTFSITYDGKKVNTLRPQKRLYLVQQMPMTEAGIDRGFTRDLYVSLGEPTTDGAWLVRVQHKPFVGWIWAGCLIMAFGGLLAALDRRYRVASRKRIDATLPVAVKPARA